MMRKLKPSHPLYVLLISALSLALVSCSDSSAGDVSSGTLAPALPVISITSVPATVYQEFSTSLEGSKDIEIRPQVDGTIEKIYVDEGAYVHKGKPLFRINDRVYREQLNNAQASLAAARANLLSAKIDVEKLGPLVQHKVISEVQLQSAQADYNAVAAQVAQAQAVVRNAGISLGYTVIRAPADGYIGRIPFKTGSLVSVVMPEPLTVLSEIRTIYAYFSLSENDFLFFKEQYPGNTVEEKIRSVPPVSLQLADGAVYPQKGKLELVTGQFDHLTGAIAFRAAFPNPDGQLRSGNTGKIKLPLTLPDAVVLPQEATYELQDRIFVFALKDSNKVMSVPVVPSGKSGNYYLVREGLKPGDRVVYSGLDRLKEGTVIQPESLSMDSLLRANPL